MNPLDLYTKPWTGWDKSEDSKGDNSNPFLDPLFDEITSRMKGAAHEAFRPMFTKDLVDAAVRDGLIDTHTGRAILPVVEFVYDKFSPI